MSIPPTIVGFNSSIRVPGFYGQTQFGASPISAASLPLILLLVGTKLTAGTATANQDINAVTSSDQADALYGAGSELSLGCYAALTVPGVTILAAPVAEAGGAVAATLTITITGTATGSGQVTYRLNGESISTGINTGDTPTVIAGNIVTALNQNTRRPYTAANVSGVVTVTVKSKGARGNQYIAFQDVTQIAASVTSALAGGTPVTGGGVPFSGGTGVESAATLIALLSGQQYDRIVCAENDSTNLGLWSTFLNSAAGSTSNLLDHFIYRTNGTRAAAITLANTANQQRMQAQLYVNGETYPFVGAAWWGATRCSTEQTDPAASSVYDGMVSALDAPQSQRADWPTNTQLNSSINNGVTELGTSTNGAQALITRSVTTHTLNGTNPDYRTLDTSQAYVPDFVRRDIGLFWTSFFKQQNPRVMDDPPAGVKELPAGIATPATWNAAITQKLRNYERGALASGSSPTAQTVPPIIINVDGNLPTSVYSAAQPCILSTIPVYTAPADHQIGVLVAQVG